jgi:hypothetical protein
MHIKVHPLFVSERNEYQFSNMFSLSDTNFIQQF